MVNYTIMVLMLSGIREILIVSTLFDLPGTLLEVIRMKR